MAKEDWLTVTPDSGKGDAIIVNSGTVYKGRTQRSTIVTAFVEEKNSGKSYTVQQKPHEAFIELDVITATVPAAGGKVTVIGKSNLPGISHTIGSGFGGKVIFGTLYINELAESFGAPIQGDPGATDEYEFKVELTFTPNTIGEITDYIHFGNLGNMNPSAEIYIKQETSAYEVNYQAGEYITSVSKESEIIPYGGTATARADAQEQDVQYTYTVDGWYDGVDKVGDGAVLSYPNISSNKTFVARGSRSLREYLLTIVNGSGSGTYPYGAEVTITPDTIENKRFKRWDDDITTETRLITITGNLTFTAIFIDLFNVLYQTSDGVANVSRTEEIVEDGADALGSTATLQEGYDFDGWYDGEEKTTEELTITPTNITENKTYIAKANIKLFPFELYFGDRVTDPELNKPFTAGTKKLQSNNGRIECNYAATDNVPYGGEVVATAFDGERGYFLGWKDSGNGEIVDTNRTKTVLNVTTPVALYAQFQTSWFTATILLGEGIDSYRFIYGSDEIITDETHEKRLAYNGTLNVQHIAVKEGYQKRVGYEVITGSFSKEPSWSDVMIGWKFLGITSDVTVKIFGILQAFTITCDLNGGHIDGNTENVTVSKNWGETFQPIPTPTKEMHYFEGWFEGYDDGLTWVLVQPDYLVKSDMAVKAFWKPLVAVLYGIMEFEKIDYNEPWQIVKYPDNDTNIADDEKLSILTKYVPVDHLIGELPTIKPEGMAEFGEDTILLWEVTTYNTDGEIKSILSNVTQKEIEDYTITGNDLGHDTTMTNYPILMVTPNATTGTNVMVFPYYDADINVSFTGEDYTNDTFKIDISDGIGGIFDTPSKLTAIGKPIGALPTVTVHTDGIEFTGWMNGNGVDITEQTIVDEKDVAVTGSTGFLTTITPIERSAYLIIPKFKDNRVLVSTHRSYRDGDNTGDWINNDAAFSVGELTPNTWVAVGGSLTVTATPSDSYEFVGWVVGGEVISTDATYTLENIQSETDIYARFQKKWFTVTIRPLSTKMGETTPTGSNRYAYGTSVSAIATRKTGYKFKYWLDFIGGGILTTEPTYEFTVTSNLHYTAEFEELMLPSEVSVSAGSGKIQWTITPDDASSYTDVTNDRVTWQEGTCVYLKAIPDSGYHFTQWDYKNINNGSGQTSTANPDYWTALVKSETDLSTGYIYIRVTFEKDSYTHTFDGNGGNTPTPATITKEYNETLGVLPTCTRTSSTQYDYSLAGWFDTSATSGGNAATSSTVVTGNKTWYARWNSTTRYYTVTWDRNGGDSQTEVSRSVAYNTAVGTLPTATKSGYNFLGWFTAKSGGTKITTSTQITGDVTYYAHWEANNITFTFNANGGNTPSSQTIVKSYGSQVGTLPTCSRNSTAQYSYTFAGWWNTSAASGGTQLATTTTMTANTTWYARWTASTRSYTVSYQTNYGTLNRTSQSVNYGSTGSCTVTVPATTAQYTYEFKGWFTAANGGGTKVGSGTTLTTPAITGAVTYYAYIVPVTRNYTISTSLHSSCTSRGSVSGGGTYAYGTNVTVSCTRNNSNDVFDGWYEGSTRVSTSASYTFKCTEARTLVAKINYLEVTPTSLSFDAAGGTKSFTVSSNVDWSIS